MAEYRHLKSADSVELQKYVSGMLFSKDLFQSGPEDPMFDFLRVVDRSISSNDGLVRRLTMAANFTLWDLVQRVRQNSMVTETDPSLAQDFLKTTRLMLSLPLEELEYVGVSSTFRSGAKHLIGEQTVPADSQRYQVLTALLGGITLLQDPLNETSVKWHNEFWQKMWKDEGRPDLWRSAFFGMHQNDPGSVFRQMPILVTRADLASAEPWWSSEEALRELFKEYQYEPMGVETFAQRLSFDGKNGIDWFLPDAKVDDLRHVWLGCFRLLDQAGESRQLLKRLQDLMISRYGFLGSPRFDYFTNSQQELMAASR